MFRIILVLILSSFGISELVASDVYKDNVVILLDASGSMNNPMKGASESKISVAKSALKEVVSGLPPETEIGLLVFGVERKWMYELGPRNDEHFFSAVDKLVAGGGTPLGAFMKAGANKLLETREKQYGYGSYRLLVITDGEAGDPKLMESVTPEIISRGIITDVIGVDMRRDHTLSTKVHSYRRANDKEALKQAIKEVLAEVGKGVAGRVAGDNEFDVLEGLSQEVAQAMLLALSVSGNEPIGKKKKAKTGESAPKKKWFW
ncbi:MAG: vWA domain-containing protein [Verrucomicrobiota bacterium]